MEEPDGEAVLREINGTGPDGAPLSSYTELKPTTAPPPAAAGSTAACTPTRSTRRPAASPALGAELGRAGVGLGVAGEPADPLQPGLGRPGGTSPGASASATSGGTPTQPRERRGPATTCPTSSPTVRRTTCPPTARPDRDAIGGRDPFIMQTDGKGVAVRAGRPGRRAAADALRAGGVAGRATRCTPSRATPLASGSSTRRQPVQPLAEPGVPLRLHSATGSPSTTRRAA